MRKFFSCPYTFLLHILQTYSPRFQFPIPRWSIIVYLCSICVYVCAFLYSIAMKMDMCNALFSLLRASVLKNPYIYIPVEDRTKPVKSSWTSPWPDGLRSITRYSIPFASAKTETKRIRYMDRIAFQLLHSSFVVKTATAGRLDVSAMRAHNTPSFHAARTLNVQPTNRYEMQ